MLILGDGRVWLNKGEIVPVWCKGGHFYQPEADTESSTCPKYGTVNDHGKMDCCLVPQEMNQ